MWAFLLVMAFSVHSVGENPVSRLGSKPQKCGQSYSICSFCVFVVDSTVTFQGMCSCGLLMASKKATIRS